MQILSCGDISFDMHTRAHSTSLTHIYPNMSTKLSTESESQMRRKKLTENVGTKCLLLRIFYIQYAVSVCVNINAALYVP